MLKMSNTAALTVNPHWINNKNGTNLSDFSLLSEHNLVVEVLLFFLHHHDGQTFLLCFFLLLQARWVFYLQFAWCHFDLQRLK